MGISRLLIIMGIVLIVIGSLWTFVGKLPGDLVFKKGNTTFYFPIVTSIIASIVLSLIMYVIGRFK
ncbi:DUF2905 domain-containing protein [Fictibacillus enclensis]|uniref:DUF2905 domain-containing protein n=1 Tax=Fictibacillus solisalsi TaxID=459525 RepID=A0A1G9WRR7_9BACL|nr:MULTISPECIES: DUF2905 domain-containing protein [Fictibacillus]MDM5339240.1 DUF2905 domain-containing protein [Fictibacillus enclensis]WHY70697.1 DUF2905 domain-containing protein [Fictibacillus enclensis]SDM86901.1 Protein of unknown function [Fictibacillus solisalsi]